jgi:hypothetical protein
MRLRRYDAGYVYDPQQASPAVLTVQIRLQTPIAAYPAEAEMSSANVASAPTATPHIRVGARPVRPAAYSCHRAEQATAYSRQPAAGRPPRAEEEAGLHRGTRHFQPTCV